MQNREQQKSIPEDWMINQFIRVLKENRDYLKNEYKVSEIGAFGSYINNEQDKESDLDILVDFKETPGLFRFVEMEQYLSETLGVQVDLVMKSSLKRHIGKHILDEVFYI